MVRVWGGGLYESEAFHDACDEFGILVWQDFPFACAYYPDDEPAQNAARVEAEHHVARLRDRASLALWCGNNENLMVWDQKFGDPAKQPPRFYGERIFRSVLPDVVSKLCPNVPYIDTSPFSEWPAKPGDAARERRGRWRPAFLGCVARARRLEILRRLHGPLRLRVWFRLLMLESAVGPSQGRSDIALGTGRPVARQDSQAVRVFSRMVALHYPESDDLEDWIYYSQLNQRDALRFAIERFRTSGFCDGALIWQFNDCWPVQSWAVQDYTRLLKPAAFELRRVYAREFIAVLPCEGGVQVHYNGEGEILAEAFSTLNGGLLWTEEISPSSIISFNAFGREANEVALRLSVGDAEVASRWLLGDEPKNLRLGEPKVELAISGNTCELTVEGLLFDAIVFDGNDPTNANVDDEGLVGFPAYTLCNETIRVSFLREPGAIRIRSLAPMIDERPQL